MENSLKKLRKSGFKQCFKQKFALGSHKRVVFTPQVKSPLAKYDNLGNLYCLLCRTVIRNELVWKVHISSKGHKLKVETMKAQKNTLSLLSDDTKKTLKTSNLQRSHFICDTLKISSHKVESCNINLVPKTIDEPIPEGFFDDPIKDLKVRKIEHKNPFEEEWERFQREMKEQTYVSNEIIAGEHEEASVGRQLEEIDEQIEKFSKVIKLEKKKQTISKSYNDKCKNVIYLDSSDEQDSIDEFSNWRSKKSFQ